MIIVDFPKVSIITVCFNSAKTIEKTIVSVLNQTYSNIEYIIIDGGSVDGTLDLIKKYESKLAYWISEKDEGISDGFNKGLSKATGDIIGIINSDDWYVEDAVEQIVKVFNNHRESGFVFGDLAFVTDQDELLFTLKGDPEYHKKIVYTMPSLPHPTVFVKNQIYKTYGGFDRTYRIAMDYEFLLRITTQGIKGLYLPTVLAYMRFGGQSDNHFIQGYREVMQISIKYGYNKSFARVKFCLKCVRTFIRKNLQRFGFELPIKWIRSGLSPHIKY